MRWPRNSPNGLRAGKYLANGYCGCLWSLIGDLDYLVSILKLPNFNSSRPCSLCRCSLAGANSWSDFSPSALWRNQLWTLTAWKNWEGRSQCPLFGCLSYCSALTVHLDYMHCKYLGVDQYVYASVLALLCCQVMSGTPQENLNRCWRTIKEYYHRHQTRIRYRYLNKLTMFLRKSGTPKLRGKAGEIRHFAPVICHLWCLHMDSNFEVHQQIHMLLKFSVLMEQLITNNKEEVAFPVDEARKFSEACENMLTLHAGLANHFAEEQTDLFTLTSKCHMLQHIAIQSRRLNPRLVSWQNKIFLAHGTRTSLHKNYFFHCFFFCFAEVWCFAGEDLQKRVQQLAKASVKGNNAASAVNKLVRHYRLAMQIATMDHAELYA